ncbi:MAG: TlpA family protein disulfide reductase [Acidobacteria bacterium]|nr:TlpA family protein disulfide reductase [Acidobacteriota bacterium]MCB9399195.1 TlpA family protein disulfide reductase [Acidobacteriota bacterium]
MTLFFACLILSPLEIQGSGFHAESHVLLQRWDSQQLAYTNFLESDIHDGTFLLQPPWDGPNLFRLRIGKRQTVLAIDEPGRVQITESESKIQVSGSKNTDQLQDFYRRLGELNQLHFASLKQRADAVLEQGDSEELTAMLAERDAQLEAFWPELFAAIRQLGATPAGFAAMQVLDFNKQVDFIRERALLFQAELPGNPLTISLTLQLAKVAATEPGKKVSDFVLADANGQKYRPINFAGNVFLLDFWASWCPSCRAELPGLKILYQTYHPQGFEILGVATQDQQEAWQKALKRDSMPWPNVFDNENQVGEAYGAQQLPTQYLIDRNGVILARNPSAQELTAWLKKLYPAL